MAQFVEFIGNHWMLSSVWLALLTLLLVHSSRTGAQSVSTQQAVMLLNRKKGVIVDVRDKKDYEAGHIVGAVNIPLAKLGDRLKELEEYKARPVVVVCKIGQHAGEACKTLKTAGFEEAVRLRGGMAEWRGENLPVVQN